MSDWATDVFEESRPRLRAVAYRMLGSSEDADDAVQEAWLRLRRTDPGSIDNFAAWLTTVVSRICLDVLRSRRSRHEDAAVEVVADDAPDVVAGPEDEAVLADSLGPALMVVLDTLAPAERLAFVLHDLFGVHFEEIAPIVDRSPEATRQLASRARRRIRGGTSPAGTGDRERGRQVVEAFLAASRNGDFDALLQVLDPDVVLRADRAAVEAATRNAARGAPRLADEIHGADAVARTFLGQAAAAQPALVNGVPSAVWAPGGRPRVVFAFLTEGDHVVSIEIIAERDRLRELDIVL